MRKIFIDGGANLGQSTEAFCNERDSLKDYEIFCFEPSQDEMNLLKPLKNKIDKLKDKVKEITLINKTIWTEDGEVSFYDKGTESNSIFFRDQFINNPSVRKVTVGSVNFSKWIQDNFSEDDHIILKLDIEGAEYEVFDQLCEDGVITWFDKIYAEIHGIKSNKSYEETIEMIEEVNSFGKEINIWGNLEDYGTEKWADRPYNKELVQDEFILWYARTLKSATKNDGSLPVSNDAIYQVVEHLVRSERLEAQFQVENSDTTYFVQLQERGTGLYFGDLANNTLAQVKNHINSEYKAPKT
jgi:FkbM family methyltransferase